MRLVDSATCYKLLLMAVFLFRNVKVYKIIKIFCFFLWCLQNMLYICTIIIKQIITFKIKHYENLFNYQKSKRFRN